VLVRRRGEGRGGEEEGVKEEGSEEEESEGEASQEEGSESKEGGGWGGDELRDRRGGRSPGSPFGKAMAQLHAVRVRKEAARLAETRDAAAKAGAGVQGNASGREQEQATNEWVNSQLQIRKQTQRAHRGRGVQWGERGRGGGEGVERGRGGGIGSGRRSGRGRGDPAGGCSQCPSVQSLHSCATIKQLQAATALAKPLPPAAKTALRPWSLLPRHWQSCPS